MKLTQIGNQLFVLNQLFRKIEVLILLLIAIDSSSTKTSDANLTNLGAFLEFRDFKMVLVSLGVILEPQLEEGTEMEVHCKFLFFYEFLQY